MRRAIRSLRPLGEFGVLFLIVVGGSIAVTGAGGVFPQPAGDIFRGLGIVFMATAAFVWISHTDPDVELNRSSLLGGVGGLGVLSIIMVLDGSRFVAVGLAVGAGVCGVVGYFADVL